jgi:hypothetical protein
VNALAPVLEDPPHVAAHLQRMNYSPQYAGRQRVSLHIDHRGSTLVRFKVVRVVARVCTVPISARRRSGDSGEAERLFRKESERHSGMNPNTLGA